MASRDQCLPTTRGDREERAWELGCFFFATRAREPARRFPNYILLIRKRKCTLCMELEHKKGISMRNLTFIVMFSSLTVNFQRQISRKSHLHASDCFINNKIE